MRHLIAFSVLALWTASAAVAQPAAVGAASEATLTVVGNGLVERAPDVARLSIDIITNDDSATRSTSLNNDLYNTLRARLGGIGLGADAIRTTGYNVNFVPHPPKTLPPDQRQARYGYVTTRYLQLTIVPIENAGKVIDAATAAGVTDVGSVSFDLKDKVAPFRDALAAAMVDARADAEALAGASGLALGRIVKITTGSASTPRPGGSVYAAALAPSTPTSIEPGGPVQITAQVTVTYALR